MLCPCDAPLCFSFAVLNRALHCYAAALLCPAVRSTSMPCHCHASHLSAKPLLRSDLLRLCFAIYAFAEHVHALPLPSDSSPSQAMPLPSIPSDCFAAAMLSLAPPWQGWASLCRCGSCLMSSVLRRAFLRLAMPLRCVALPLPRISSPRHAVAVRFNAKPCYAVAAPI